MLLHPGLSQGYPGDTYHEWDYTLIRTLFHHSATCARTHTHTQTIMLLVHLPACFWDLREPKGDPHTLGEKMWNPCTCETALQCTAPPCHPLYMIYFFNCRQPIASIHHLAVIHFSGVMQSYLNECAVWWYLDTKESRDNQLQLKTIQLMHMKLNPCFQNYKTHCGTS